MEALQPNLVTMAIETSLSAPVLDVMIDLARMQQQVVQMEEDMAASERRILSLEVENRKLTGALGTARKKIVTSSGQNSDGDVARVPAAVVPGGSKKYVVRNGDNLYDIARKFYHDGTKWRMILRANESTLRSSEKNVKPGQTGHSGIAAGWRISPLAGDASREHTTHKERRMT